ncbi:hypothetical protein L8P39_01775 [Enterobacter cloacae]|nr:hypothetical protein [Enterobacter cloacae]MCK7101254.1 hypothetical protein [Enterobacter cloacae]MCM7445188.1 hypothetical protein [Enterobacter hormaechei]
MLLPVFVCDGQNLHRASSRATYPRSAPYICSTLYDVWREHPCATKNPWSSRH